MLSSLSHIIMINYVHMLLVIHYYLQDVIPLQKNTYDCRAYSMKIMVCCCSCIYDHHFFQRQNYVMVLNCLLQEKDLGLYAEWSYKNVLDRNAVNAIITFAQDYCLSMNQPFKPAASLKYQISQRLGESKREGSKKN